MKPLIIYHAQCADGFGAAYAAWHAFGGEAEYLPLTHNVRAKWFEENKESLRGREVYVLDFSFDLDTTSYMFEQCHKFVWLDHHKTAFEMWCLGEREYHESYGPNGGVILLDNNRSGALITWEYFFPTISVPLLLTHIDDYDRWQFKQQGTKELNKALWSRTPWSFEQWNKLATPTGIHELYIEGEAMLKAHSQNVKAVAYSVSRDCLITLDGESTSASTYKGLIANCPAHLTSDVGHELANQSGTYGLLWYMGREGKIKCSLRSNGEYDVSHIAQHFGGGGHKNAAGFEIDLATLLSWLR